MKKEQPPNVLWVENSTKGFNYFHLILEEFIKKFEFCSSYNNLRPSGIMSLNDNLQSGMHQL